MNAYEAAFTSEDMVFVYQWSGGHPRIAEGICQVLDAANEENVELAAEGPERWQFYGKVATRLQNDAYLNEECRKIWIECSAAEQVEMAALAIADHQPNQAVVAELLRRYVLVKVEGRPQISFRGCWRTMCSAARRRRSRRGGAVGGHGERGGDDQWQAGRQPDCAGI